MRRCRQHHDSVVWAGGGTAVESMGTPLLPEVGVEPKSVRLGFVAGVVAEEKLNSFERILFRATRGNMFFKYSSVGTVVDPATTEKVEKAVFVVFFAGERARTKILKVLPHICWPRFLLASHDPDPTVVVPPSLVSR